MGRAFSVWETDRYGSGHWTRDKETGILELPGDKFLGVWGSAQVSACTARLDSEVQIWHVI
jgi:hypothetical protein